MQQRSRRPASRARLRCRACAADAHASRSPIPALCGVDRSDQDSPGAATPKSRARLPDGPDAVDSRSPLLIYSATSMASPSRGSTSPSGHESAPSVSGIRLDLSGADEESWIQARAYARRRLQVPRRSARFSVVLVLPNGARLGASGEGSHSRRACGSHVRRCTEKISQAGAARMIPTPIWNRRAWFVTHRLGQAKEHAYPQMQQQTPSTHTCVLGTSQIALLLLPALTVHAHPRCRALKCMKSWKTTSPSFIRLHKARYLRERLRCLQPRAAQAPC